MQEQIEQRVAFLKDEVYRLKDKIEPNPVNKPWWETIAGTFADDPIYDEAMQLGQDYRQSTRPNSTEFSEP